MISGEHFQGEGAARFRSPGAEIIHGNARISTAPERGDRNRQEWPGQALVRFQRNQVGAQYSQRQRQHVGVRLDFGGKPTIVKPHGIGQRVIGQHMLESAVPW
jgi:hypothetical protein